MILVALGLVGDYVARNYEESKGRPLYVVTDLFNLSEPQRGIGRASILGAAGLSDTFSCRAGLRERGMIRQNSARITHAVKRG